LEVDNGQWVGFLFYKERGHFDGLLRLNVPSQIDWGDLMGVCFSAGTQCGPGMTGRRMSWRGRYELSGEFVIE
jgi:hypothetical protein